MASPVFAFPSDYEDLTITQDKILTLLVAKVDIPKSIQTFINSPMDTWNSWTNSFVPWVQSQWASFTDWITQHFKK